MQVNKGPYCLLVKRATFETFKLPIDDNPFSEFPLNREGVLKVLVPMLAPRDIVVGTTGMLSRELFEVSRSHKIRRTWIHGVVTGDGVQKLVRLSRIWHTDTTTL
jgi:hypothetical protein